jgi:hypothetical protein
MQGLIALASAVTIIAFVVMAVSGVWAVLAHDDMKGKALARVARFAAWTMVIGLLAFLALKAVV